MRFEEARMTLFSTIDIGRTGVGFARYWLDTIAHNVANTATVRPSDEEPFRARRVFAQALADQLAPAGSGVAVRAVVEDGSEAARVHDPANPLADEDGYVTLPVVDLATELADLIVASRAYQANLRTVDSGREAYQAALRLGQ